MSISILLLIIFGFIVFVILLLMIIAGISLAPWLPTPSNYLEGIHKLANLKSNQKFYELGCGNGKVAFFIAHHNKQSIIKGFELAFPVFLWGRIKHFIFYKKYSNLSLVWFDVLKKDLSDADVIFCYALQKNINKKLKQKLQSELSPGTKIILLEAQFTDWTYLEKYQLNTDDMPLYLYII